MGAGQSGGEALVGAGADVSGLTFLYEAFITGRDAVTGRNLTPFEQGFRGTLGADAAYLIGRGAFPRCRHPAPTAPKAPTAEAPSATQGVFPKSPVELLPEIPRTPKGYIQPSDYIRIRPAQHAIKPGETFAPRHHGQHYHVEIRIDPSKSWNYPNNVMKVKPPGYTPGQGTGFLPGELYPGM